MFRDKGTLPELDDILRAFLLLEVKELSFSGIKLDGFFLSLLLLCGGLETATST